VEHRHRLGGRRPLVQQRGVGDLEAGQVAAHRLEVQQRLESALGDFGLIRRIMGVPARVLENVALEDRRGVGVVVAHPDERAMDVVALGQPRQLLDQVGLAIDVLDAQRAAVEDVVGDRLVD